MEEQRETKPVSWSWSSVRAMAERLDQRLEAALREHEADLGTRFFHESEFSEKSVLIALEDWKYKLRHKGIEIEQSFTPPLFADTYVDLWNNTEIAYSDPRFDERMVRGFIKLAMAALPEDAWLRASIWLVAVRDATEVSVKDVGYDETVATYRAEGLLAGVTFKIELERSLVERGSPEEILGRLTRELRPLLAVKS